MYGTWSKALRVLAIALLLAAPALKFAVAQDATDATAASDSSYTDSQYTDSQYYDPAQDTAPDAAADSSDTDTSTDSAPTDAADTNTDTTTDAEQAGAEVAASRGIRMGAYGAVAAVQEKVQTGGFFHDWVSNMFSAVAELAKKPLWIVLYIVTVGAFVVFSAFFDGPIKVLGSALTFLYSIVQTYALFKTNHYVTDFARDGAPETIRSLWFALLFTGIFVWGIGSVVRTLLVAGMKNGLGGLLAPLSLDKLLDKFRSKDADLEEVDDGSAKNPKRQNTAIMFTDIVGYSAQMGKNEAAMVAKLNIHNEIMRNQIVRNRGTVIKTIGDAFMVRFRSAESAVMCALDCQKAIGEYNKGKTPDDQFHIRIGCHMGEVIHTGTDVFGEGVNIAARIEPKCDPDGVTVSDVIANAARNKVPAHFSSIGRHPMKNITNPPELFKVFAIEPQAAAKSQKSAAGAAATGGAPGGTFKI
jgi:class 3 adenylate cyclase